ncbi:dimethylarginine dimethylaminohydrolase family protein [Eubacterium multiforme]|uniref:N-dimethylarginine dimethylaminohydrolase n=1 Tax=Eubacterium multiforme TaxID=83339 RepID=A0ABT9UUK2_9FIRM|nr:arginine deiminase family protein [Eubacterium multiforme]MDQ0149993.1 N-dimethylarginine dimethylaminohydrolase [Eubacterium multiforme]
MKEIKYVLMRYPSYLEIINPNNKYKNLFCKEKVFNNYNNLLNILSAQGIKYYFLNTECGPSEVFTRDLGISLGDTLLICNLTSVSRKKETKNLMEYVRKNKIKHYVFENKIEGGDVVIFGSTIFVGISQRTNEVAIEELTKYVEDNKLKYKVVPIRFDSENKLHLDCVFNILDKKSAILSDYVYDSDKIEEEIKNIYHISNESADNLGTNILALGKKRIICSDTEVMKILKKAGYKAFYCEYDEIIKVGGGIGCSTLPIMI